MRATEAARRGYKLTFDRLYIRLPHEVDVSVTQMCAENAAHYARSRAPKLSGASSRRLYPIWGPDYFGIRWVDKHVWYQEMGIKPFLMNELQGKTIPMWVDDPDGSVKLRNKKAETRVTGDGRQQTLIFRKVAKKGDRKQVRRTVGGIERYIDVPASYPGAPGRINRRNKGRPFIRDGGGRIASGNVGVRWRHPGLGSRFFMHEGLLMSAYDIGLPRGVVVNVAVRGSAIR